MACSIPQQSATEKKKNSILTRFFRDLLKNRIAFKISRKEATDIILSIDTLVNEIVLRVAGNVEWLGPYHRLRVLPVGSMAERTSIKYPDEFDYIVVTYQDGVNVQRMCDREGYAHIKVTDPGLRSQWKPFLNGDYLQGSFNQDINSSVTGVAKYVRSSVRKYFREDNLRYGQRRSILNPYYDSLANAFMSEVEKVIKNSPDIIACTRNTGTLHVNKNVVNHGPAFMPTFIWTPTGRHQQSTITVDMTLAIEVDMSRQKHIISKNDTFRPCIWEKIVEHGKFMLIPCNDSTSCAAGLCFRLTFTETEVELVCGMNNHHKECYQLLKYIFNGGNGSSYLPSYVYKMLVIKHHCFCRETENLASCFKSLVASLLCLITFAEKDEMTEFSRLLRIFIPGKKSTLYIPSIFIKRHNILDGKDFILSSKTFLLAIESMLESINLISTKHNSKEYDLQIVNNHWTAFQVLAKLVVPFLEKQLKFCKNCVEEYLTPYGVCTCHSTS